MSCKDDFSNEGSLRASLRATIPRFGLAIIWTGLTAGVSAVCLVLLTKSLSADDYGAFCFAQVLFGLILFAVSEAGRPVSFALAVEQPNKLASAVFSYWTLSGGLAALVGIVICWLLPVSTVTNAQSVLSILCVGMIIASLNSSHFLDAQRRHGIAAFIRFSGEFSSFIILVVLAVFRALTLTTVAWVFAVKWSTESAISGIVVLWPRQKTMQSTLIQDIKTSGRSWLTVAGSAIIAAAPLHCGVFFVRACCSPQDVAIQGFVQQFAMGLAIAGAIVVRFLQPTITRENTEDTSRFRRVMINYFTISASICLMAMIVLFLLTRFLLAPEFRFCVLPATFQAIAWFVVMSVTLETTFLLKFSEESFVLGSNFICLLIYVAISALLVPHFAVVGACCATMISALIACAVPYLRIAHIGQRANRYLRKMGP